MNTNKSLKFFSATLLVSALSISNGWAEVTHDEAVTKIQTLSQKVEGVDAREKLVSAYDTLTKAGVSADKSLALIESAVEHKVPAEALIREAREIQAEAKGNRGKADEYASETMSQFSKQEFSQGHDQGRDLAHEMRDNVGMSERQSGMDMSSAGSGFGGADIGSGAGAGIGGGMDMSNSGSGFGGSDQGAGAGGGFGGADVGGGAGADIGGSVGGGHR